MVLRDTLTQDGLVNDPGTIGALSEFLEADGPDRLRFRNSLVRDSAYEGLAYKTRTRLHRAAGIVTAGAVGTSSSGRRCTRWAADGAGSRAMRRQSAWFSGPGDGPSSECEITKRFCRRSR